MMTISADAPVVARRFDRSSWLTVAFVAGMTVICALMMVVILREPGDGCLLNVGEFTTPIYACVGDWATPLRPGDRILAVAGLRLDDPMSVRGHSGRLEAPADSTAFPYTVERAGEQLELTVPIRRLDSAGLLRAIGVGAAHYLYPHGWLLYIFLGAAIIFALAPRVRAAQLLVIASGGGAAVTNLLSIAETITVTLIAPWPITLIYNFLTSFWTLLLIPTLLLLVISFPRRVWPLARWPRTTLAVLYGLPLAANVATMSTGQALPLIVILALGGVSLLVAPIAVTAHTLWRVHDPVVRAQTAWMGLGLTTGIGVWPVLYLLIVFIPQLKVALDTMPLLANSAEFVTIACFTICLGIAITRYRLFDIDIVINRALVYTLLTGALAAIYLSSVAVIQGVVRSIAGQESELAIVASTLAVAAGFQPLRVRIQAVIDRLFFRRKYDATQVLAAYGLALRDDTNLEALRAGLLRVTDETMRPVHVSLWLREPDGRQ